MQLDLVTSLYVFLLAAFIGFEVIRRVSPLLHTPLMSLTNALDAIAVVGAIILAGEGRSNRKYQADSRRCREHRLTWIPGTHLSFLRSGCRLPPIQPGPPPGLPSGRARG